MLIQYYLASWTFKPSRRRRAGIPLYIRKEKKMMRIEKAAVLGAGTMGLILQQLLQPLQDFFQFLAQERYSALIFT